MTNNTPKYAIGDLVLADKHGRKVWVIDGYRYLTAFNNGSSTSGITYSLQCVVSNKRLHQYEEELFVVCKEEYALDYLSKVDINGNAPRQYDEPVAVNKNHREPFKRNKQIDAILDEMSLIFSIRSIVGSLSEEKEQELFRLEDELNVIVSKSNAKSRV